jgi:spore germination cell wall hydrolase CwlJ-like protein
MKGFNVQEGIFWLVLTVFLESRNQPVIGQKNIVKVILNRAEMKQWSISTIIFSRKQFSCYNEGLMKAMTAVVNEPDQIATVTTNVMRAIDEWMEGDNLDGATHYFNPKSVPGGWPATWDKSKMRIVRKEKDHVFLIEV